MNNADNLTSIFKVQQLDDELDSFIRLIISDSSFVSQHPACFINIVIDEDVDINGIMIFIYTDFQSPFASDAWKRIGRVEKMGNHVFISARSLEIASKVLKLSCIDRDSISHYPPKIGSDDVYMTGYAKLLCLRNNKVIPSGLMIPENNYIHAKRPI